MPRPRLQPEEGFVNAVDFNVRRELLERIGQAQAQIAIELIVRGEDGHVVLFNDVPHLEEWDAHRDAERLSLARARDDTPVVVREHDHGAAAQGGVKDPLTAHVELVCVRDGDSLRHTPPLMPVDRVHDPTPDLEVHALRDTDRLVGRILRHEQDAPAFLDMQLLDRELLPEPRHDYVPVLRLDHTVHDQQLARMNTRLHRVALDPDVEGRQRVLNEVAVEVYSTRYFVLGGGRKPAGTRNWTSGRDSLVPRPGR